MTGHELLLKVERADDGELTVSLAEYDQDVLVRALGTILGALHLTVARDDGDLDALGIEALGESVAKIMSEANRVLDAGAAGDCQSFP